MIIYAKVGTFPGDRLVVRDKPNQLVAGTKLYVKSETDSRLFRWTECIVDKVDRVFDEPLFFLSIV